jgi:hypothetical protein
MLITLTASRPYLAKTTQITPLAFGPIPRHRLLREGMIKASAKKTSVKSRKSVGAFRDWRAASARPKRSS